MPDFPPLLTADTPPAILLVLLVPFALLNVLGDPQLQFFELPQKPIIGMYLQ